MPQQNSIKWKTLEYKFYEKNLVWYITFCAIALLIFAFFIYFKDYFGAISCFLIATIFLLIIRRRPENIEITIDNKGVKYKNLFLPYANLKYFWIVDNQNFKTLNFETTTFMNNYIIIELEDQDPKKIEEFLLDYLPRHASKTESMTEIIMNKFRL